MLSHQAVLLPEEEREQERANTQRLEAAVVTAEMMDVGLIFGFKQYLPEVLAGLGHVILFPIAAAASLIRAILKIRAAYLAKKENKRSAILKAVVELIAAFTIIAAVIGAFVAAATFDIVAPILFTVALGFKTFFHLGASLYYAMKVQLNSTVEEKKSSLEKMKANLILAAVAAMTTVASGLVFVAHKATFGILGIVGGILGAAYAAYQGFTTKSTPFVVRVAQSEVSAPVDSQSPSSLGARSRLTPRNTTAAILEGAHISLEEFKATQTREQSNEAEPGIQEADLVVQREREALVQLKEDLDNKRKYIEKQMALLEQEHRYGAQHAFNLHENKDDSSATLATYWWKEFYKGKFASAKPEAQTIMMEIDKTITQYNDLIQNESSRALLDREKEQQYRIANERARLNNLQEEKAAQDFKNRTGLSKEAALEIAELCGLGARYG